MGCRAPWVWQAVHGTWSCLHPTRSPPAHHALMHIMCPLPASWHATTDWGGFSCACPRGEPMRTRTPMPAWKRLQQGFACHSAVTQLSGTRSHTPPLTVCRRQLPGRIHVAERARHLRALRAPEPAALGAHLQRQARFARWLFHLKRWLPWLPLVLIPVHTHTPSWSCVINKRKHQPLCRSTAALMAKFSALHQIQVSAVHLIRLRVVADAGVQASMGSRGTSSCLTTGWQQQGTRSRTALTMTLTRSWCPG